MTEEQGIEIAGMMMGCCIIEADTGGSRKGGQAARRITHFDSIHGPVLAKGSSQQKLRKKTTLSQTV